MTAIVVAPARRMTVGAALIVGADVTSLGRFGERLHGASVLRGEEIAVRGLAKSAAFGLTERGHESNGGARGRAGESSAGVDHRGPIELWSGAGERPRHSAALTESFEFDAVGIDA